MTHDCLNSSTFFKIILSDYPVQFLTVYVIFYKFFYCGNRGVILLHLSCSVIETIETRWELILLAIKFTLGGFDESVLGSSECRHNVRLYLCVAVVLGLLGVHKYDADYSVQLEWRSLISMQTLINFLLHVNYDLAAPQSNFFKSIKINALVNYSVIQFN